MVLIDHVIGFPPLGDAEALISHFAAAKFKVYDRVIPHAGGVVSRFILLNDTYIEISSVESEDEFKKYFGAGEKIARTQAAIYALSLATIDANATYGKLKSRVAETPVPQVHLVANKDGEKPGWSVIEVPTDKTPGAKVYAVEYLQERENRILGGVADNGVIGLAGVCFASHQPVGSAMRWASLLQDIGSVKVAGSCEIRVDDQVLFWIDPRTTHVDRSGATDGILGIVLSSADISKSKSALSSAGFSFIAEDDELLFGSFPKSPNWRLIIADERALFLTATIRSKFLALLKAASPKSSLGLNPSSSGENTKLAYDS
ncbi:VOC family protein [Agrobacterium tumefaciens]|uniref:VOC family protein n=1 Tax=Agrobacterium tumefaciens TaxID=358 RepID=UPI00046EC20B